MPLSARSSSPTLALALADCLTLYCIQTGRLRGGRYAVNRHKYSTLPTEETALPAVAAPVRRPIQSDAARELAGASLGPRLKREPDALIVPLYQLAAKLDDPRGVPGAHYGLYCMLLLTHEDQASDALNAGLARKPPGPAFLLEKARVLLRLRRDPQQAYGVLLQALGRGRLDRPLFSSIPAELRSIWIVSRQFRSAAPQVGLSYDLFFRLLDRNSTKLVKGSPEVFENLVQRLRLAELMVEGNLITDIEQGLSEGTRTLARLSQLKLTREQVRVIRIHRRQLQKVADKLMLPPTGVVLTADGIRSYRSQGGRLTGPAITAFPSGGIYLPARRKPNSAQP